MKMVKLRARMGVEGQSSATGEDAQLLASTRLGTRSLASIEATPAQGQAIVLSVGRLAISGENVALMPYVRKCWR